MRGPAGRLVLVALVLSVLSGCDRRITIMSYNVGGLFDPGVAEAEGPARSGADATQEAFRRRCAVIAAAIRRSVPGGPDLVALQEVGSEGALRALRDGWLRGLGYHWYVVAGGPDSPIRVGVLGRLALRCVRSHRPAPGPAGAAQRAVLELECTVGETVLHVFNNHWKSKIGGEGQTEAARVEAARAVAGRVARILDQDPAAEVLVLGDFNEDHNEGRGDSRALAALGTLAEAGVVLMVDDPEDLCDATGPLRLYEPWFGPHGAPGSYAYGKVWSTPDHILLTRGLFDGQGLRYLNGSFRVAAIPFLVDDKTGLPRGHGAHGSTEYSDHLPILVTLEPQGAKAPRQAPPG